MGGGVFGGEGFGGVLFFVCLFILLLLLLFWLKSNCVLYLKIHFSLMFLF